MVDRAQYTVYGIMYTVSSYEFTHYGKASACRELVGLFLRTPELSSSMEQNSRLHSETRQRLVELPSLLLLTEPLALQTGFCGSFFARISSPHGAAGSSARLSTAQHTMRPGGGGHCDFVPFPNLQVHLRPSL